MNKILPSLRSSILVALICIPGLSLSTLTLARPPIELKVGIVPQFEQRKLYRIWRPVLDRIEQRTNIKLTLVGTAKISEFERRLYAGEFDIAYMNPYHLIKSHEVQGYEPILRDGKKSLKGILVVHRDSVITDPKQLQNKTIAFPSANALGASLLMRAELAQKFNLQIKPLYVKTHSSVYLHVAKQLVVAGGGVQRTFDVQDDSIKTRLKIIYETRPVAPHPLATHPRVNKRISDQIIDALMDMQNDPEDKKLLEAIPIRKIIRTNYSDYLPLRSLGLKDFYVEK